MEILLKNYRGYLAILLAIMVVFPLIGQEHPPSHYIEKYNGEFAVRLKDHSNVEIEIKRGELEISHHVYQEELFLDKRASSFKNTTVDYEPPFSQIESLKAYTLKPEIDKDDYDQIKVKDIRDEHLMHDEYFDGRKAKVFTFPGVMEGAITVLEYEKKIVEPRLVGSEVFQSYLTKEEQIFQLAYDEEVEVDIQYVNCTKSDFEHHMEQKSGQYINTWVYKNPEKIKQEHSMPEFLRITPHIIYYIKSYKYKDETIPVLRNVNDLQEWYVKFLHNVMDDESDKVNQITDSLVNGLESDSEKVKVIFNWVQNNIKYIAIEEGLEGFRPRPPSLVMDKRYGDCKDMSCLTISMLKHAGIPAYYTWVGTRKLPYTYNQVPSPLTDNHMIASVKLNNQLIFLDATDEGLPFPLPSSFIQGKEAMVVYQPDSFEIQKVPVVEASKNLITDTLKLTLEGADLKGKGSKEFYGYYSSRLKRHLKKLNQDKLEKVLKPNLIKGNNKCRTFGYQVDYYDNKVKVGYQLEIPDYAYTNENEAIVNLNLEKLMSDYQIKEDREHPMVNDFRYNIRLHFVLDIPEAYELSYIPKNLDFDNKDYSFSCQYKTNSRQVIYDLVVEFNSLQINKEEFDNWNKMIKELNKNYNESIIFKKL